MVIDEKNKQFKLLNKKLDECDEKELSNLFNIWIHSVIDLYNNKAEFILLGNVDTKNHERNIFKSNYNIINNLLINYYLLLFIFQILKKYYTYPIIFSNSSYIV